MEGVTTHMLSPLTRDDQYDMLLSYTLIIATFLFTIVTAGTGSGKARCIAGQSQEWIRAHKGKALVIINAHNKEIAANIISEHVAHGFSVFLLEKRTSIIRLIESITAGVSTGSKQVVIYYGNSHSRGDFLPITRMVCHLFKHYESIPVLYQIDEIHKQVTHLTGGINGKIFRKERELEQYRKIVQQTTSLNFFDEIRRYGNVRTIGWSATTSNLIASKLGSLGYEFADILSINVKPIPSLYPIGFPKVFDPMDMKGLVRLMQEEENKGRIILIIGPTTKWLDMIVQHYKDEIGSEMSYLEITSRTSYADEEMIRQLSSKKYVLGVDKVSVGFNLATYTSSNFGAVFMCKKCSDRVSQPLSGNPSHKLHCGLSAGFIQAIARGRDNECTLYVQPEYDGARLIDALDRVYEIVTEAGKEANRYGPVGATQADRMHHQIYVSLCQSIRDDEMNTPTVSSILHELYELTGRRLEAEYQLEDCDHLFWRTQIADIWQASAGILRVSSSITSPCVNHNDSTIIAASGSTSSSSRDTAVYVKELLEEATGNPSATSAPLDRVYEILKGGGGIRGERTILLSVIEEIERRACGLCACCSTRFTNRQMAHIYPHDQGGDASADNMFLAHAGCHAMMDDSTLILDPIKQGYWCLTRFVPTLHVPQIIGISHDNLMKRLRWHYTELSIPSSCLMRTWLSENEYVFHHQSDIFSITVP